VEGTGRCQRHALGIELILPDWFYAGVLDAALVLTIDPAYFRLTGGIERWLYRLVRKHGGRQPGGWQFDFRHLHRRAAPRASTTSPTTCARWSRGSRCPATSWASSGCRTTAPSC
jgi:plasmid replication initiation protein